MKNKTVIFQEDSSGCWVTKVMPNGNAANHRKILIGDQLASINGRSSIGMKVDEICALIASSATAQEIELTFLRYVGPFQPTVPHEPGTRMDDLVQEEGYEVEAVKQPPDSSSTKIRNNRSDAKSISSRLQLGKKSNKPTRSKTDTVKSSASAATDITGPLEKKKFRWFGRGKNKKSNGATKSE